MNETQTGTPTPESLDDLGPRFGSGARALMVAAGALLLVSIYFIFFSGGDDASQSVMTSSPYDGAETVEVTEISEIPKDVGHAVYWAGERGGKPVGVSSDPMGNVHVRYLPPDADPAQPAPAYFDVGSYPFPGAYAATKGLLEDDGNRRVEVPGAVAFYPESRPTSVILSFRKNPDVQVEVFHPVPKKALSFVRSGAIVPVP